MSAILKSVCDLCAYPEAEYHFSSLESFYVTCCHCGLIYAVDHPENLQLSYDEAYTEKIKNNNVGRSMSKRWQQKTRDRLQSYEHYRQRNRILDIGASYGEFLNAAKNDDWSCTGIDISEVACQFAREHYGVDMRCGTVEQLFDEFEKGEFDVIWAGNLLEHLVSVRSFLDVVSKLLRIGGIFAGTTINANSWAYKLTGGGWEYVLSARYHRFVFTPDLLRRYCELTGLELTACKTKGFRYLTKYDNRKRLSKLIRITEKVITPIAEAFDQGHRIEFSMTRIL